MARVTVTLKPDEREALRTLAERERRDPRQQAALNVVHELKRAGMLPGKGDVSLSVMIARISRQEGGEGL